MSIFGIFILLINQGIIAINIDLSESINSIDNSYDYYLLENDPPWWANVELNGIWGISENGQPVKELGNLEGFMRMGAYEEPMRRTGVVDMELPTSQNQYTYYMDGITISYFILGLVVINNTKIFYIGFGNFNEDGTFYYNLFIFTDKTWYIKGTWREINFS
jgi:hypothetical protein